MITGIAIENFKGIGERIHIDLKPITLLFGPNSAGKSSILHALHYAAEIFERRNLNADHTVIGGEFVDLGGFATLVHGHDLDKTMWLQFDLTTDFGPCGEILSDKELIAIGKHLNLEDWGCVSCDAILAAKRVSVEIGIRWSFIRNEPYIAAYRLYAPGNRGAAAKPSSSSLNDSAVTTGLQLLAEISAQADSDRVDLSFLDLAHPSLYNLSFLYDSSLDVMEDIGEIFDEPKESILSACMKDCGGYFQAIISSSSDLHQTPLILLERQSDALPKPGESIKFALRDREDVITGEGEEKKEQEHLYAVARDMAEALSAVLTAPLEVVGDCLREIRYLGPIREVPPRDFRPSKSTDATSASGRARWASGLGAWEEICRNEELAQSVNEWLANEDRLDAGYEVQLKKIKELDIADPLVMQMLTGRAFDESEESRLALENLPTVSRLVLVPPGSEVELEPADVGIGISQVVPVVVTALADSKGLLMIEQPELHLHPRIQAELGDLFVEAIDNSLPLWEPSDNTDQKRTLSDMVNFEMLAKQVARDKMDRKLFLIETHSEHLILRLLRRIRETENGTADPNRQLRTHDLAIHYLRQEDGCSKVSQIDVDVKGEFIQPWPDDFFEIDFYERFS